MHNLSATKIYDGLNTLNSNQITISGTVIPVGTNIAETLTCIDAKINSKDVSSNGSNYINNITLVGTEINNITTLSSNYIYQTPLTVLNAPVTITNVTIPPINETGLL